MTDIEEIVSETAIHLARWDDVIAGIPYPRLRRPLELNTWHSSSSIRRDIYEKLRKQPYAYENFMSLYYNLSKLPNNSLEDMCIRSIQLRSALLIFPSQRETISNILKENNGRMRDAQNAYIRSLDVLAGRIFEGYDRGADPVFSSPSGWGFQSLGQQTYSNQDMPYNANWRQDIVELLVERIDCFIAFFEKLLGYRPIPNGRIYESVLKGPNPEGYSPWCGRNVFCEEGYDAHNCGPDVQCIEEDDEVMKAVQGKTIVREVPNPEETYTLVYDYKTGRPPLNGVTNVIDKGDHYEFKVDNKVQTIMKHNFGSFFQGGKRRIRKTRQRNKNKKYKRKTKRSR
jgi:hypothetical protein